MNFGSPIRYPGGKGKLTDFIEHLIKINNLESPIYCEPFSGGAGVAINLLLKGSVDRIILNDIDMGIYSIWKAIISENDRFIGAINEVELSIEEWKRQKSIYSEYVKKGEYDFNLAVATFYLNRTNRAGIIAAGPIGGFDQKSKYKMDCRFNKKSLIKRVQRIGKNASKIELYNYDAELLIDQVIRKNEKDRLFVFFDPPYYNKGQVLYTNYFDHQKHEALKRKIDTISDYHWIVTYDLSPEIQTIYLDYDYVVYELMYSLGNPRLEKEYIYSSRKTKLEAFGKVSFSKNI